MSAPETTALVLEIGCEEIPARFLEGAERDLGERLSLALGEARLLSPDAPAVKTASTPRRLIAYAPALFRQQSGRVEQITGPPVKAAFDQEGKPTRAAESFAAKNNAQVSDLKRVTTPKGEYLALEITEPGRSALEVLVEVLPGVIGSLSFPKSMYWTAKSGPLFVRPIRWILAVLGDRDDLQVVPFEFAGVKSGSFTYGHRLQGSEPLAVTHLDLDLLLKAHRVIVHGAERRERVQQGVQALLEGGNAKTVADEWLENWVVNSTEWPVPLMGGFNSRYLALPREVLVTVMRDHQKYFAVEDKAGNLQPQFITVLNVPGDPKGLIRQGHERVLAARFADAEFFWNADQRIPLRDRIPMLERVTYQAKLGTYGDKVRRMRALTEKICKELEKSGRMNARERQHALRAVELCKCDLTTQMVQEFTELQGVIGGLYAREQGEPDEVADAIYDHYRPVSVEDACPRTVVGAVVSLADKLDTVVAGFAVGLEPTGSSDPFGLRRAGNGVIKLAAEALAGLNLGIIAEQAAHNFPEDFLRDRLDFYLREACGLRYDTVRAVLANPDMFRVPSQALEVAKALEEIRDTEDFIALATAAKRTRNILSKSASGEDLSSGMFDEEKLVEAPEQELYREYKKLNTRLNPLLGPREEYDYKEAFREMAKIRPSVDGFFDNVLVMTENQDLRRNRLQLLVRLNKDVFTSLADLAEIAVESRSKAAVGQ
ncbi:MAG TPA: glycine--tRNA ligase subunit beta [Terriglobia bacterium]|nr:glycine--tRNA ligase subunit beta [Terriglobia bacterium]